MKIQSINPTTGKVIKEFKPSTKVEVNIVVTKAKSVQVKWAKVPLSKKKALFGKLKKLLEKNATRIISLIQSEVGRTIPDAEVEIYDVIDAIDYYYGEIKKVESQNFKLDEQVFPRTDVDVMYVPQGVIGLIMPWNFPFYVPMMYIIPALYTGNAIVFKSSEYSTLVGLEIIKLFKKAGFPKDLVQGVIGADKVGKALVKSEINKVFVVGSVEAGRDIVKNIGIKPVQVELGGNSSGIVLSDADLDLAANGIAWSGTYNAGQECVGMKRVYVMEDIAKDFIQKLVEIVSDLKPGRDYGPYIRHNALKTVEKRLRDAVKEGAKLLCGGDRLKGDKSKGFWLTPSVILFKKDSHELVRKETFGNTVPVSIVKNEEELIKRVNDTRYGLSNAIYTKNIARAEKLAKKLESGMVFINDPFVTLRGWDHWTGWKDSGMETTESKIMQCLKKKVISRNRSKKKRSFWYPYPE
jgi:succinate-semialdehyde dehydrogenase/glutarate-semialdehyde dehydrogenase